MLSGKILGVILALMLAYAAVYFGDGLRLQFSHLSVALNFEETAKNAGAGALLIALGVFCAGGWVWYRAMRKLVRDMDESQHPWFLVQASLSLIITAACFGIFANPFASFGPYPWRWSSILDVFLLLAAVPLIFVIHGIVREATDARGGKKPLPRSDSTVTKLNPRG